MRNATLLALSALFALVGLLACTGEVSISSAPEGQRMPEEIVILYDAADPAGWMEIELERDGTIIEMEADIPVDALPAGLLDKANEALPGGEVTGAEIEYVKGVKSYEVKKRIDGKDYEIVLDESGNVLEREEELSKDAAPAPVIAAAEGAIAGAAFKSVEVITVGDEEVYHVKLTKGGATYKVVLDPTGGILRKVREQKAEIEIPLE